MKKFTSVIIVFACVQTIYSQNLLDSTVEKSWFQTQNKWNNMQKVVYSSYDLSDSVLEYYSQSWLSTNNSWRNSQKYIYYRNSNGDLDSSMTNTWDQPQNKWRQWNHSTFTYNSNKKVTLQIDKAFLGTSWRNSTKLSNTYDSKGYLTEFVRQTWNATASNWRNSQRIEYVNNTGGFADTSISAYWNMTTSKWTANRKSTYTYDGKNNVLSQEDQIYLSSTSTWRNSSKWTYTYNANNDVTKAERQTWDLTNNSWRNSQKTEFTYDTKGYLTKELLNNWWVPDTAWRQFSWIEYTNHTDGRIDSTHTKSWSLADTNWRNSRKKNYYYNTPKDTTDTNVSVPSHDIMGKGQVNLYPNPASNFVRINLPGQDYPQSGTLTSIDGRVVKTVNLENGYVDLNGLQNGMYILRLNVEGEAFDLHLIKQE